MKKIEVAYPFEAARGALGGRQKLLYNDRNNPAFDAPIGRQYAKNYRTQMVAAKRASDGLNYFMIKKKSATLITVASLKRMAVLGGTGSMIGIILTSISLGGVRDKLEQSWQWEMENVPSQAGKTFRKFLTDKLYQMLDVKNAAAEFYTAGPVYQVLNPWFIQAGPDPSDTDIIVINVPSDILVKFWQQLGTNSNGDTPIYFAVDGAKGIAVSGMKFEDLIAVSTPYETRFNNLGLTIVGDGVGDSYVKKGNSWLKLNTNYIIDTDVIGADTKYVTTAVAPA
ncbi:MAG: hypothetical protein J6S05_08110 [Bacteroidaceae bacterium]|nr:hypothetical protein [Bacteroidaceae bacterium]